MTRKSIVARQKKREKIVAKFKNKREQLKSIFQNMNNSYDDRMAAYQKFQNLPRNAFSGHHTAFPGIFYFRSFQ